MTALRLSAKCATARRALSALLLAGLFALFPARLMAQSMDWMPADDEIGFWGVKLPAPEGATDWHIGALRTDPQGHFTIFYAYAHGQRRYYIYHDLTANEQVLQLSFSNKKEEDEMLQGFHAFESTMTQATIPEYRVSHDTTLAKNITSDCHIGGFNPPVDCGFEYEIDTVKIRKALLVHTENGMDFNCGGPCEWTFYNKCAGKIHFTSESIGFRQIASDKSMIALLRDTGFVIRFKPDMTSPFIDQRHDMALVDFDDAIARYQGAVKTVLKQKRVRNLLEEVDAIVAPHFLEQIQRKEGTK